jgi:hypothetical protein
LIANVKEKTMANKRFWLGMLVTALAFGMTVLGCYEEEDNPYPQRIDIRVDQFPAWDSSDPTTGSVKILFQPPLLDDRGDYTGTPARIGVDDLQWLQANGITLTPSGGNGRTVSITSIEKTQFKDMATVTAFLKRSAVPSGTAGTATVSITFPNEFTAKYPDGITWEYRNFDF